MDLPPQLDARDIGWPDLPAAITGASTGEEWWERDLWLVATEDGIDWFTLDVPDMTEEIVERYDEMDGSTTPLEAHMNDDLVLYGTVDGWRIVRVP